MELGTHRGTSSKSGMHGNRSEVLHKCRRVLNRKVGPPEARLSDLTWMGWQEGGGKRAKGDGQ